MSTLHRHADSRHCHAVACHTDNADDIYHIYASRYFPLLSHADHAYTPSRRDMPPQYFYLPLFPRHFHISHLFFRDAFRFIEPPPVRRHAIVAIAAAPRRPMPGTEEPPRCYRRLLLPVSLPLYSPHLFVSSLVPDIFFIRTEVARGIITPPRLHSRLHRSPPSRPHVLPPPSRPRHITPRSGDAHTATPSHIRRRSWSSRPAMPHAFEPPHDTPPPSRRI